MMRESFALVHEISLDHHGYFTTEQAREVGVGSQTVVMMAKRGTVTRVAHGLYRNPLVPPSPLGPYMAATLWPHQTRGVISHQTALELLGISDANPDRIHLTLPKNMRVRRRVPKPYVLHQADLSPSETTLVEDIPVTNAARTIRDCHAIHVGPALLRQAIRDGQRTGRLTSSQAAELDEELLSHPREEHDRG